MQAKADILCSIVNDMCTGTCIELLSNQQVDMSSVLLHVLDWSIQQEDKKILFVCDYSHPCEKYRELMKIVTRDYRDSGTLSLIANSDTQFLWPYDIKYDLIIMDQCKWTKQLASNMETYIDERTKMVTVVDWNKHQLPFMMLPIVFENTGFPQKNSKL